MTDQILQNNLTFNFIGNKLIWARFSFNWTDNF